MGLTYAELDVFGKLRKIDNCGPVQMFEMLILKWGRERKMKPSEIASKVKTFFYYYSINRHKMTVLTPSYHAEKYGNDDNRYDHR
jgi:NAD+ synthase (glutamine-hydrolysing)